MPAVLFKDFGKVAGDNLSDDYDFNHKLKIKTKTSNNVTLTTEGSLGSGANKAILAKLGCAFEPCSSITFTKLQVTTHGRIIGEGKITKTFLDGLNFTFKAEDGYEKNSAGLKYKSVGKVGAEYVKNNVAASTEADFANNIIATSAAFSYDNVLVGGNVALSVPTSSVSDKNLGLSYAGQDFTASVVTKQNMGIVTGSFHHKACSKFIYSALLDHNIKSQAHDVAIGGRYFPDSETTMCSKITSNGILSFAHIQKMTSFLSVSAAASFDLKSTTGESNQFGLGITLG